MFDHSFRQLLGFVALLRSPQRSNQSAANVEAMMFQSNDVSGAPQLDFEAWRDLLRTMCGRYDPKDTKANAFAGWVRSKSFCGFAAMDVGCNAQRIERTYRDTRLDSIDHYFAMFQVAGQSAFTHNDQAVQLAVGDVAFVDAARPGTFFANNGSDACNMVSLGLPRQSLVSHLGFEPQGGRHRRGGTSAGRLLFNLIRDADQAEGSVLSPGDSYMQLAIYDLVGALFAPSEPSIGSRYSDTLFKRIRGIIEDSFADPNFGPNEVAAETGISLRYLQKIAAQHVLNSYARFVWTARRAL